MEALFNLNKNKKDAGKDQDKSKIKQAENIWSMLDEMALTSPDSYKKFIEKTISEGKEAMKPPVAHMCVKSKLTKPKSGPLFVNIFSWQKILGPKTDEDPIPVYGSKLEFDKINAVVNLVFNPEVLEKYGKDAGNKTEQDMLINLAFQYTEEQNPEIKIDTRSFEILKTTLVYGNLDEHISKLTRRNYKSNMSDLDIAKEALKGTETNIPESILSKLGTLGSLSEDKTPENSKSLIEELNPTNVPSYEENLIESKESAGKKLYELRINLPKVFSMNECELDIDEECITLGVKSLCYDKLKVSLASFKSTYEFLTENIEAKFIKKTSILRVRIPLSIK